MSSQQLIVYGVIGVAVIALIAFRMRRMMTARPYNPYLAWIVPLIFIGLTGLSLWRAGPVGMDWAWVVAAAALGAAIGWFRGRSITITLDPATGGLTARGGAAAIIFIVILIAVRSGLHYLLDSNATSLALRPVMADAIAAVMGAGIFVTRGVEMGLRGHRLLEAHKANPAIRSTDTLEAP